MSATNATARIPTSTQTHAGVLLVELELVVDVVVAGWTSTRWVVVRSSVVTTVVAGAVVDSITVVVSVAAAAVVVSAAVPLATSKPARSAPAAKQTTRPVSFTRVIAGSSGVATPPVSSEVDDPERRETTVRHTCVEGAHRIQPSA